MKKAIASVLTIVVLLTCLVVPPKAYADTPIKVYLDGTELYFDIEPCIINDRTFVPVRAVLESAGVAVSWDESARLMTASKDDVIVWFSVDNNSMTIQRENVTYVSGFEVAPCIINDRIFIPVKQIAQIFGIAVAWDPYTRSVILTSGHKPPVSTISISGFVPPVTTTVGRAYSITGDVSTNTMLDRLNVKVKDSATGEVQINETQFDINASSYNLSDIDSRVKFGTLSAGAKLMEITAVTKDETRQVFSYNFEVVRPGGVPIDGDVTMLWPVPSSGIITTIFWCDNVFCHSNAGRVNGHAAIDIAAPQGADVVAVKDGVVISCGFGNSSNHKTGYGNFILLDHGNGLTTQYSHLYSIYVSEGQTVSAGQVIGGVGTTGNSTGNHLDFYIEQDGKRCDPLYYIDIHPNVRVYEDCDKKYFNEAMAARGLSIRQ